MRMRIELNGDNYTQVQALAMKDEITAYAAANGLKGIVAILEPL